VDLVAVDVEHEHHDVFAESWMSPRTVPITTTPRFAASPGPRRCGFTSR